MANEQAALPIDGDLLCRAATTVLKGEQVSNAVISLAVVDDVTIHRLNRQYLSHDYPTDVLSFLLSEDEQPLEGEVIVSAETALLQASAYGWEAIDELLLYVVHGTLHLVGYDDASPESRGVMRAKENEYLASLGRPPRVELTASTPSPQGDPPS